MDLQPSEDQRLLLDAVRKLIARLEPDAYDGRRALYSSGHDAALAESGLLDTAGIEEYGPLPAAMLVEEIAKAPIILEVGASAMLRPQLFPGWPRPVAVLADDPKAAARFLPVAKSVLFLDGGEARIARLGDGDVEELPAFFTYPVGRLRDADACLARAEPLGDGAAARRLLRIAVAAEIAGALRGALDTVVEHVKSRYQFGRPLGSFQATQHRLASAASTIAAIRLLTLRAAALGTETDALTALGHAQENATAIVYDLHQFMGAMGLTLEHPLHRWSYRLKLLLSDLGGATAQFRALGAEVWEAGTA